MKSPALSAPDERILLAVGRLHYLTNEQLRRLFYGGSLSYVQGRTRKLSQLSYLLRIELKSARRGGSSPIVYTLDRLGRAFVEAAGYSLPARFRKSEMLQASPMHLEHTLAVNDVLIAFEQLQGRISLLEYWHERDIKRMSLPVYPDAWIALRTHDHFKTAYLLEVDRSTEKQLAFRDKVRRLTQFFVSARYEQTFGTNAFEGVLVVAPDLPRARQLTDWISVELSSQPELTDAFRITTQTAASDPEWLAAHL